MRTCYGPGSICVGIVAHFQDFVPFWPVTPQRNTFSYLVRKLFYLLVRSTSITNFNNYFSVTYKHVAKGNLRSVLSLIPMKQFVKVLWSWIEKKLLSTETLFSLWPNIFFFLSDNKGSFVAQATPEGYTIYSPHADTFLNRLRYKHLLNFKLYSYHNKVFIR